MRIAFLSAAAGEPANDNRERLSRAFAAAGWEVASLTHESLSMMSDGVMAAGQDGVPVPLGGFELLWVLGFGARESFLDRMHILRQLDPAPFVNTVDALVFLHGKLALPDFQPETYASADAALLAEVVAGGGAWVAKPAAGSFGRGVRHLRADAPDVRDILAGLTEDGRLCVLQRHVGAAREREKRVVVAGDSVVGVYAKSGNLSVGAVPRPATLTRAEAALVRRLVGRLNAQGVRFAGVDLAYPWVIEANVANPGGLATLEALTGVDPAPRVVRALERSRGDGVTDYPRPPG